MRERIFELLDLGHGFPLQPGGERRFRDRSGLLRLLSALFILVFFTVYTSSGLVASGKLFGSVFGIDYQTAVITGGGTGIGKAINGGFGMVLDGSERVDAILPRGAHSGQERVNPVAADYQSPPGRGQGKNATCNAQ